MLAVDPLFQIVLALASIATVSAIPAPNLPAPSLPNEEFVSRYLESLRQNDKTTPNIVARNDKSTPHIVARNIINSTNKNAPEAFYRVEPDIIAGFRSREDYGPVEKCWFNGNYHPTTGEAGMECILWAVSLAWDVRRLGALPLNCRTTSLTETWKIGHSSTVSHSVNIGAGVNFDFFKMNIGYEFSTSVTKTAERTQTVSCGQGFKGTKCYVGGQALIEIGVRHGWVKGANLVPDEDKLAEGGFNEWTDVPKFYNVIWDGKDDESQGWGLRNPRESSYFTYNPRGYGNGWDMWEEEDDGCNIPGNRWYDVTAQY